MTGAPWLSLREALWLAAQFIAGNERLSSTLTKISESYRTHPPPHLRLRALAPEKVIDFTHEAARGVARHLLEELLSNGRIGGEGFHEDIGRRATITESEWGSRKIDWLAGALVGKDASIGQAFPPITGIIVRRADLLQMLDEWNSGQDVERRARWKVDQKKPRKLLPWAQGKELRSFLITWDEQRKCAGLSRNEQLAHAAAEDHFDRKIGRSRLRHVRHEAGLKGEPGRRRKPADRADGAN